MSADDGYLYTRIKRKGIVFRLRISPTSNDTHFAFAICPLASVISNYRAEEGDRLSSGSHENYELARR